MAGNVQSITRAVTRSHALTKLVNIEVETQLAQS